jgi:hypothetical protein
MVPRSKEKSKVTETTEVPAEAVQAPQEKVADWKALPEVPPPEPQPGTVVTPEPTVSAAARAGESAGVTVDSTFTGIKVTNY